MGADSLVNGDNNKASDPSVEHAAVSNLKTLKIYAYYRVLLSSILLLMYTGGFAEKVLGESNPTMFLVTIILYTSTNITTLIMLWRKQYLPTTMQIIAILLIDIVAITILSHSSGGFSVGNLGYMLLVCVAAGGIFLGGKTILSIAGFTTILILMDSTYFWMSGKTSDQQLFSAGIFGILLFATAYVFSLLSEKIRKSNIEAIHQAEQAAYLENLAHLILERMRTGIIVVNKDNGIVLINQSAQTLLGLGNEIATMPGTIEISKSLFEHLQVWRAYPHTRSPHLQAFKDGPEIRVNFANMQTRDDSDTLIFIEDNRIMSQEAQQLKLASLGRLTASIAHEVRNPLGAISHAAQLLSESPDITDADGRLTEIIQSHSRRVNTIIENVLQLSRRKASLPELVDLAQWIPEFIEEFKHSKTADISIVIKQQLVNTRVDVSQLQRVLTNLIDNGVRYSEERTGSPTVTIEVGIDKEKDLPYMEVIDDGPGIPGSEVEQVFEPFFTTASTGSGLGLYISRELCEANQANLIYKRTLAGKSCFRLNFAHPERIF